VADIEGEGRTRSRGPPRSWEIGARLPLLERVDLDIATGCDSAVLGRAVPEATWDEALEAHAHELLRLNGSSAPPPWHASPRPISNEENYS